jgi:hypothetical protein
MTTLKEMVAAELAEQELDDRVTENEDGTKTVTLDNPVEHGGKLIEAITFRRPCGRDMRELDKESGDVGKGFRLASALGDVSMAVIDKMGADEALLCARVAGGMGKRLKTGGKL